MPLINLDAVLNPLPELKDHILDYIPRATTSEFGIVALGSGINVDIFGRIYLDTQEYSDRLTAIETTAASTLETTVNTLETKADELAASITQKLGTPNGIATLDSAGSIPSSQLPSYVDDVLEYENVAAFPAMGETGKIYVETPGNTTYRWSGTAYVKITSGEVSSVAGKKGIVTLTKDDVGLSNVDNTNDLNKPLSTATQTALTALENKGKRGIINLYDASLIYGLNERVVITNGDIVKSTIDGNTNDPNVDMTGWVKENSASQIFDTSGRSQQEINDLAEVSVKLYGASGNGTTSDVTAVTSAMAAADQVTFTDGTYLIDSNITINKPVSFTKKAKLKVTNGAIVTFAAGVCDEICAHWFSGNTAIQDAVNAAKSVKSVYIRSGVWLLDNPVIIPDSIPYWGVNISGATNSQQYASLGSSQSTVLKANSAMSTVIGNRLAWKDESGYYNKVSNMTIDGNKLANYGYINGYQDTLSETHVQNCLIGGIIFGALSNSGALQNVSSARNARGLILTGNPPTGASTHTVISNSRFRENDISGVTICQAIGVKFTDCEIESNKGIGIEMVHNNTTHDFYAGTYAFISNVLFERIGMENNPITIGIDGTGGAQKPSSIEFKGCNFVGKTTNPLTPVGDIRLKNTRGVFFDRNYNSYMSLNADTNAYAIQIKGYQVNDSDFPVIYGVNAGNVQTTKVTDIGDTIEDHIIFANHAAPQKNITTSTTLARNDVAGSIITNSGQEAVDLTITLPNTGYNVTPRYSPSFTFVVLTQRLSNKLTFKTQAGSYIIYNGAQRTTIDTGGDGTALGLSLRFTLTVSGGIQYWLVERLGGTWYAS